MRASRLRHFLPLLLCSALLPFSFGARAAPVPDAALESIVDLISSSSTVRGLLRDSEPGIALARELIGHPIADDSDLELLAERLRHPPRESVVPALSGRAWLSSLSAEAESSGIRLGDEPGSLAGDGPRADYETTRRQFLAADRAAQLVRAARVTPVTDQGGTLQCWAVAATSRADVEASRRLGSLLKLSPRYTVYAKTRAEVTELILKGRFEEYRGRLTEDGPEESIYYEQGGVYADAVEAIRRYGAMPEPAYGGFPSEDEALFRKLNELIRSYAHGAGSIDFSSPGLRARVEREVTDVLDQYWGKPPESFEFEGRRYTPREFLAKYLPEWRQGRATELNYAPGNAERRSVTPAFDGRGFPSYETGDHGKLLRVIQESLRAGKTPLIQYKVLAEQAVQADGTIGFAAHGLDPPAQLDWNDSKILDHYVLAIGAQWDEAGNLERILVKNTWDTAPAAHYGFHWIEKDYFPFLEAVEIPADLEGRFRGEGLLRER